MEFFDEKFWLAISFIILIYIAFKPIKNAILSSLDKKIESIKQELIEAETLKIEAVELLKQTKQKLEELDILKEQMIREAKIESEQLIKKKDEELELFLKHKKAESLQFINAKKRKAFNKEKDEFINSVVKLITEYFKASDNLSMSDFEIVKKIREDQQ